MAVVYALDVTTKSTDVEERLGTFFTEDEARAAAAEHYEQNAPSGEITSLKWKDLAGPPGPVASAGGRSYCVHKVKE